MNRTIITILLTCFFAFFSSLFFGQISTTDSTYQITIGNQRLSEDTIACAKIIQQLENQLQQCESQAQILNENLLNQEALLQSDDTVIKAQVQEIDQLEKTTQFLQRKIQYLSQLKDSLIYVNDGYQTELQNKNALLESKIQAFQEKEALFIEKENLYKEALANSNVNSAVLEGKIEAKDTSIAAKNTEIKYLQNNINEKENVLAAQKENYEKLSMEKERYQILADSLRDRIVEAEKTILKTNEQLKYTEQRAKDAEAKVAAASSKKKKVSIIQGIAMKTFRTPNWDLMPALDENNNTVYKIVNRNAGKVEFDYITGASVMLWDLSKKPDTKKEAKDKIPEIRKFDQDFSYSIGFYVGFGGSNLFKNFYAGPTFKFLDFFHFSTGINVCEYEVLNSNVSEGDILPSGWAISGQVTKSWKVKPFFSLSLDMDFLSYIKK